MADTLAVVCAWCNRIVKPGPPGTHVTHTICVDCIDRMAANPSLPAGRMSPAGAPPLSGWFGDAEKS
jgi:hypothetical protein